MKTKVSFNQVLSHVIQGLKNDIPISHTLKKYGWEGYRFYQKTNKKHLRLFDEIKCLRLSKRGQNMTRIFNFDIADFNVIDVCEEEIFLDHYEDVI